MRKRLLVIGALGALVAAAAWLARGEIAPTVVHDTARGNDGSAPSLAAPPRAQRPVADDRRTRDGEGGGPTPAPGDAGGGVRAVEAGARPGAPESGTPRSADGNAADEAGPRAGPAVHRSPYGLPPRRGSPLGGGPGPGGGGMTGHWTKFPPGGLPRGTASLAARILDADGVAVPDAEVFLGPPDVAGATDVSFGDLHSLGATDAQGTLRAASLPAGAAAVCAKVDGLLSGRLGLDARSAREVLLRPRLEATVEIRLPFALASLGRVEGRVVDARSGAPLAGAAVDGGFVVARTAADGRFRLARVPAGPRPITATRTGYAPGSVTVDVPAGGTVGAEVRLAFGEEGPLVLRGVVRGPDGEAVPDASLYLMVAGSGGTLRSATADATGAFELAGLPERLRTAGFRLQADAFARGYAAAFRTFPEGLTEEDVVLTLPARRTTLSVLVVDATSGDPVPRALVTAHPGDRRSGRAATLPRAGPAGLYEGFVDPGTLRLRVETLEHDPYEAPLDVVPVDHRFAAQVRLVRRRDPVVDVALTVTVRTAAEGRPVTRAKVEVLDGSGGGAVSSLDAPREDGVYRLPAYSGTWRLRVTAEGLEAHEQDVTFPVEDPEPSVAVALRPR